MWLTRKGGIDMRCLGMLDLVLVSPHLYLGLLASFDNPGPSSTFFDKKFRCFYLSEKDHVVWLSSTVEHDKQCRTRQPGCRLMVFKLFNFVGSQLTSCHGVLTEFLLPSQFSHYSIWQFCEFLAAVSRKIGFWRRKDAFRSKTGRLAVFWAFR